MTMAFEIPKCSCAMRLAGAKVWYAPHFRFAFSSRCGAPLT
jgi:hypothetical protein